MSLAVVHSRAQVGLDAPSVLVEVHLTGGLPSFSIVGLPEAAVKESKDRVRSALMNSRFEFPMRRITVNLAPADLPKEGSRFDLAIAIGILAASSQIPSDRLSEHEFVGELALTGALRPVVGVLTAALAVRNRDRVLVIAEENAAEGRLVKGLRLLPSTHLLSLTAHLFGHETVTAVEPVGVTGDRGLHPDLSDVRGQHQARRALEICATGGHNLLFVGPPGTGKTMLAGRLPGILPDLTETECLDVAAIASISSVGFSVASWGQRPFRTPHHTASGVALVGGGSSPRPGEISLAHRGVLFLDELPEFDRRVLEVLREPLESGRIVISRAARQQEFPARFQLVAAMNPCPCGYLGDSGDRCKCSQEAVRRYRARVSGPLLDRIDVHVHVPKLKRGELSCENVHPESSGEVRSRVVAARERQQHRANKINRDLLPAEVSKYCRLSPADARFLEDAIETLGLSARAWHRILKVARSIADLADTGDITNRHLAEAMNLRQLDRRTDTH